MNVSKVVVHLLGATKPLSQAETSKAAKELFDKLDENRDGTLQKCELYAHLAHGRSVHSSYRVLDKLFSDMDKDGDNVVSRQEWVKGMMGYMERIARGGVQGIGLGQSKPIIKSSTARDVPGLRAQTLTVRGRTGGGSTGAAFSALRQVSSRTMKQLQRIFREIDADSSGALDFHEFKQFLSACNLSNMAGSIFASLDIYGTGQITFKQLLRILYPAASSAELKVLYKMSAYKARPAFLQDLEDMLEEVELIFSVYDSDGSGMLDRVELVAGLQQAGHTAEEAERIFTEIDADDSGECSFEEYKEWYVKKITLARKMEQDALNSPTCSPRASAIRPCEGPM